MEEALTLISWDNLCEPTWHCQNGLYHKKKGKAGDAEAISTVARLLWYWEFQHEVLEYRHRFLIDYDERTAENMMREMRHSRLTLLNNARQSHATECRQTAKGQSVIPNYMATASSPDGKQRFWELAGSGNTDGEPLTTLDRGRTA